ncbi:MAG: histidine phosphatase family protein, partial [Gammaproteobacteria bacterium]
QLARAGIKPGRVYSGDMERQKDTATLALKSMGHVQSVKALSAFNEYDSDSVFAAFLPAVLSEHPDIRDRITPDDYSLLKDRDVFRRLFFPVMSRWIQGHSAGGIDHESWSDFNARVVGGLKEIRAEIEGDECAVVFTSGGVISTSLTHVLGMDPTRSAEFNWRTANASITKFMCTDDGFELEGYNNYAHLHSGENGLRVTYL